MPDRLQELSDAGVSIWLDDLSRERLETGNLADLVKNDHVVGVTTNPTIFAAALANGERYDDQLRSIAGTGDGGDDVGAAIFALTTDDVRNACDVLAPVYEQAAWDGRVSIEVSPRLAHETQATIDEAQKLWDTVDRPNALIKIPATQEGLAAITEVTSRGISVNVTLIFSTERYQAVMDAYLTGLEQAVAAGRSIDDIHSVASFFVSRVDTEIDKRLDAIGGDDAKALKGKAAVANAWIAYGAYADVVAGERWAALLAQGANPQRPLWASTGVKNPDYPDTLYVSELVVDGCVNTMPEKTMQAFADHGEVEGDTVTGRAGQGQQIFDRLADLGIDFDDVFVVLEDEGVQKFIDSWGELEQTVQGQLAAVTA